MFRIAVLATLIALGTPAWGFSLLTWNAEQGSIEAVTRREGTLQRLGSAIRSATGGALPDVVVLQEVTSYASAARIARALGFSNATIATSDSGSDRKIWPAALEVAIITMHPVVAITSYQSFASDAFPPFVIDAATGNVTFGTVKPIAVPPSVALPAGDIIPRAVLRVELEGGIVIYGVHLNSSGLGYCRLEEALDGAEEIRRHAADLGLAAEAKAIEAAVARVKSEMSRARNPGIPATQAEALKRARTREAAAGAVAALAAQDVAAGKSVFVAGDFNTPLSQPCKTGHRLDEDFVPMMGCSTGIDPASCGPKDGFDDTYAVLTDGIIDGVRFKVLTSGLGRTFASEAFVDSPIDNVLVAGSRANSQFSATKLTDREQRKPFGSDHFPVLVIESPQ